MFKYSILFNILHWRAPKQDSWAAKNGNKYMKFQSKPLYESKFSKYFYGVRMLFVFRIIIIIIIIIITIIIILITIIIIIIIIIATIIIIMCYNISESNFST